MCAPTTGPTSYPSAREPLVHSSNPTTRLRHDTPTRRHPALTSALCLGGLHCMYDDSSIVSRSTHVSAALLYPSPWPSPPLLPPIALPVSPPPATPCPALARLIPLPWEQRHRRGEKHVFRQARHRKRAVTTREHFGLPSHSNKFRLLPLCFGGREETVQ